MVLFILCFKFMCMCLSTPVQVGAHGGKKRVLSPLQLMLQVVGNARTGLWFPERILSAVIRRAFLPASNIMSLKGPNGQH